MFNYLPKKLNKDFSDKLSHCEKWYSICHKQVNNFKFKRP